MSKHRFSIVEGTWTIALLAPDEPIPRWASDATGFVSITRTKDELSIICPESVVPPGGRSNPGWALLVVHGPLPFAEVGVLSSFASPLAARGISLLPVGTFDTDYILVRADRIAAACEALVAAGHELVA